MSFYLDFKAKDGKRAKAIVAEAYLPPVVRSFLETALQNASPEEQAGPWHIVAKGHLVEYANTSSGSQSPSSAELKAEPLFFTKPSSEIEREALEKSLEIERRRVRPATNGLVSQAVDGAAKALYAGERR